MRPKTIVFTFGRFNPPTRGHEKLFKKAAEVAEKIDCDYDIFLSHSHDNDKNPIPPVEKLSLIGKMFPEYTFKLYDFIKNPFDALEYYNEVGYRHVIMVVGGDRLSHFSKQEYSRYQFSVSFVSAGERVDGYSASRARQAAKDLNFTDFCLCMPDCKEDVLKFLYEYLVSING